MLDSRTWSSKHRHSFLALTVAAFVFGSSFAALADESALRKEIIQCINQGLDVNNTENEDMHLTSLELKFFKDVVDKEVMKEPLKPHTEDEQKQFFKDIEDAAKKKLPEVPTEKIDKIMIELKKIAARCTQEL
ncbi:hypothetical protein ENSA5_69490 [Enhygromyxa salina]|uniref:Uncharacterized protein n=1 Tax=Enhygromyxa salina TaxID=215803 RepID=A0A2S9XAS1_9BACT|nr:hypothetical protein [Enhygromyxa salina]PRP89948.1 hypothetical protein ENSA5_69490 [Enhygromyxa salina]